MKRIALFALLIAVLSGVGCDNELDLVSDWKEIPVVYGFLSRGDTAQYIRVEKAFLDPKTSAYVIAKNPDSLYFPNAIVQLEDLTSGSKVTLTRVDGTLEGYPRAPGVFATAPNFLYKIKTDEAMIFTDREYRILVSDEAGRLITSSKTKVVGDYTFTFSSPPDKITFLYDNSINIGWRSNENTAYFYDVAMRIHVQETETGGSGPVEKVLTWPIEKNILRGNSKNINTYLAGVSFYQFMRSHLEVKSNVSRKFLYMEIQVDAGGKAIYDFLSVGKANSGITGAEYIPSYSNIDNGFGLFSSRYFLVGKNFTLSTQSLDSLKQGIYTKDLNF
ncbi:MAG: DUF4249 family protein [Saprospiraceae bacterium]|nr:DUF4249 family protein [Saprospiraceae bacterium]